MLVINIHSLSSKIQQPNKLPMQKKNSKRWQSGKVSACQCRGRRDVGLIPWLGRFPGGGNGKTLQYSCLENLMNRGAWWAAVHGVAKSRA